MAADLYFVESRCSVTRKFLTIYDIDTQTFKPVERVKFSAPNGFKSKLAVEDWLKNQAPEIEYDNLIQL
jgi:hypothetical protein